MKVKSESEVATPGTAANQAPPSMGFSRQEYWSGVPLPSLVVTTDDFQLGYSPDTATLTKEYPGGAQ